MKNDQNGAAEVRCATFINMTKRRCDVSAAFIKRGMPTSTESGLAGSTGSMTLGVGSSMLPATFWTGLIDHVRVYSRAVEP